MQTKRSLVSAANNPMPQNRAINAGGQKGKVSSVRTV
jgi:hypothetical protein